MHLQATSLPNEQSLEVLVQLLLLPLRSIICYSQRVKRFIVVALIFFVLGALISFLLFPKSTSLSLYQAPLSNSSSQQYPLLSPRIFTTTQNDLLINFVGLRSQLREYTTKIQEPLGFYFECLPSNQTT